MRVAVVAPTASPAIADVTFQALAHVRHRWDAQLWHPADQPDPIGCPVPVRTFRQADEATVRKLAAHDLVVWVLGDSPAHYPMFTMARRLPGLVVLHDAAMTGTVRGAATAAGELSELIDDVTAHHGPDAAQRLRSGDTGLELQEWLQRCVDLDLNPQVLEGSLGVVVHSAWHARLVDGFTLGDVTLAPLPVPSSAADTATADDDGAVDARLEALPDDAVLLVTVGNVNANRCVDLLIDAVAADPWVRERTHVWAVGAIKDTMEDALRARADELGVRFVATGRVADRTLGTILSRATFAAALRDPVLEGQSASVLTQMLAGIPVLVLNHAHYADLPDDAVVKVAPGPQARGQIATALHRLGRDDAARAAIGAAAARYAGSSRSGRQYADALVEAGARALAARPLVTATRDVATALGRLTLNREPAVLAVTRDLLGELYGLI